VFVAIEYGVKAGLAISFSHLFDLRRQQVFFPFFDQFGYILSSLIF